MFLNKLIHDFKEFAIKGNMIDIAIGVIIGAAFNDVVDALVKQLFMPPLTLLTDGVNWKNKKWVLEPAQFTNGVETREEVSMGYGIVIEAFVDFFIIAITVFIVVKLMNSLRRKADDPKNTQVTTPKNIELLDRIGDLLEKQNELLKNK
ncbi:MAG: large conductance mechanosensitive channel protein MscL [Cytophagaceae bacterium]|nr:large conductance mechanosensitive channel protein MscL [Cytophagaceae bacterium]|tara:strand:- start:2120 stop:2566 length:447 start_codon:yes stop_codon:yes gene_type:complete